MFQECFKERAVPMIVLGYSKDVSIFIQACFKGVLKKVVGVCFKGVSRIF